ncbi:MAG: HAMP domain-containing protein [Cyanobacteria bacterium RI_101]|nr:HAMP domain-containing protein [Cyanobacteria bacterium RI_101]
MSEDLSLTPTRERPKFFKLAFTQAPPWLRRLKGQAPVSLQFRLTLEVVTLSVLGLSGVSLWAGWQLEQNLIAGHKQTLEYIATRFPEQLELYLQEEPLTEGVGRVIQKVGAPGLVVWVKDRQGRLLGQSANFRPQVPEARLARSLRAVPARPQVIRFDNRDIVLCGSPLLVNGEPVGELYLSQDITADQQKLQNGLWQLFLLSAVIITLLCLAIFHRVGQALTPLKAMSQAAGAVSADDLQGAKLELRQAPAEILGLAQAFNAMLARLSVAWEQQREFVGNVSHELRTPLTIVAGYLQSLQRRSSNLNETQTQALASATAETERVIRLLQDLLDLARADGGHLHFRCRPTVLNTLILETAAMSQQVSRRRLNLQIPEAEITVWADPDRLQQVLINLIDNAFKYSPPERPVDIALKSRDGYAWILVQDYGPGIPLAHQQRIFERFYRVNEGMTRGRDGAGLGLAIARALTEAMDGALTVRSQLREGSIFTLKFPLWRR